MSQGLPRERGGCAKMAYCIAYVFAKQSASDMILLYSSLHVTRYIV